MEGERREAGEKHQIRTNSPVKNSKADSPKSERKTEGCETILSDTEDDVTMFFFFVISFFFPAMKKDKNI